jgi:hypothetical protein
MIAAEIYAAAEWRFAAYQAVSVPLAGELRRYVRLERERIRGHTRMKCAVGLTQRVLRSKSWNVHLRLQSPYAVGRSGAKRSLAPW